jgi:hypothetical protein
MNQIDYFLMERKRSSTINLAFAIVILIAWSLAFILRDYGIGCIIAVFAVVITIIYHYWFKRSYR